jgi:hypothetical protein
MRRRAATAPGDPCRRSAANRDAARRDNAIKPFYSGASFDNAPDVFWTTDAKTDVVVPRMRAPGPGTEWVEDLVTGKVTDGRDAYGVSSRPIQLGRADAVHAPEPRLQISGVVFNRELLIEAHDCESGNPARFAWG